MLGSDLSLSSQPSNCSDVGVKLSLDISVSKKYFDFPIDFKQLLKVVRSMSMWMFLVCSKAVSLLPRSIIEVSFLRSAFGNKSSNFLFKKDFIKRTCGGAKSVSTSCSPPNLSKKFSTYSGRAKSSTYSFFSAGKTIFVSGISSALLYLSSVTGSFVMLICCPVSSSMINLSGFWAPKAGVEVTETL